MHHFVVLQVDVCIVFLISRFASLLCYIGKEVVDLYTNLILHKFDIIIYVFQEFFGLK